MIIKVNTDNTIKGTAEMVDRISAVIEKKLKRFDAWLTGIDVYVSDASGRKPSASDDKKCVIEAKLKGYPTETVTSFGNTVDMATDTASDKMKSLLTSVTGKLKSH